MPEHRLSPPYVHVLFDPGSQNFARSGIKKSFYGAERFSRPVLVAATICHFRIIHPDSRHDLPPIAKCDLAWLSDISGRLVVMAGPHLLPPGAARTAAKNAIGH